MLHGPRSILAYHWRKHDLNLWIVSYERNMKPRVPKWSNRLKSSIASWQRSPSMMLIRIFRSQYLPSEGDCMTYQVDSAINKLPWSIASVAESLYEQTGWCITIMVGGPLPRDEGHITTLVYVRVSFVFDNKRLNKHFAVTMQARWKMAMISRVTWARQSLRIWYPTNMTTFFTKFSVNISNWWYKTNWQSVQRPRIVLSELLKK